MTQEKQTQENKQPVKLPTAYVMWLTIRSQFIDHLIQLKRIDIEEWNEFEQNTIEAIELHYKQQAHEHSSNNN